MIWDYSSVEDSNKSRVFILIWIISDRNQPANVHTKHIGYGNMIDDKNLPRNPSTLNSSLIKLILKLKDFNKAPISLISRTAITKNMPLKQTLLALGIDCMNETKTRTWSTY
jgi:hypothetical protein